MNINITGARVPVYICVCTITLSDTTDALLVVMGQIAEV